MSVERVEMREGGCAEGVHTMPLHPKEYMRPEWLRCTRCGKLYRRDTTWRQGYRPATPGEEKEFYGD